MFKSSKFSYLDLNNPYDNLLQNIWQGDDSPFYLSPASIADMFPQKGTGPLFANINGTSGDDTLNGTNNDDIINAFAGNDTIYGMDGFDTIDAGDGDDRVHYSGDGGGNLDGGAGYDVFEYDALTFGGGIRDDATDLGPNAIIDNPSHSYFLTNFEAIEGYDGGNLVSLHRLGSNAADVIDLTGFSGDTLYIAGAAGNDTLTAGSSANFSAQIVVYGQSGNDTISISAGNVGMPFAYGGTGNDLMSAMGSLERVEFYGEDGDDTLTGSDLNDILIGGLGADIINGGDGDDHINIFTEIDIIRGGDIINAGSGDDYVWISAEGVSANGGAGNDKLNFNQLFNTAALSFTHNPNGQATFTGSGLVVEGFESYHIVTSSLGADFIQTGDGDDYIQGDAGADELRGGAGDDAISSEGNNARLYGEDGNDSCYVESSVGSQAYGGAGNDSLYFGGSGSGFNALLDGGDGDDVVSVSDSNFTAIGGSGDDMLQVTSSPTGQSVNFTASATDTVSYGAFGATVSGFETYWLNLENADDNVTLLDGDDIVQSYDGNDILNMGGGADFANAGEGSDTVNGGSGDDGLYGEAGDDVLNGDAGHDTLSGGADNDFITGGTEGDFLYGDAGDDTIHGDNGDDEIYGGEGNDSLNGGAGHDRIEANLGTDIISGGGGADRFVYYEYSGGFSDTITDFDGFDVLELQDDGTGFTFIGNAAFSNVAGQMRYEKTGGQTLIQLDYDGDGFADETLTLSNGEFDLVEQNNTGGGFELIMQGGAINGTSGHDTLIGTVGDDLINGLEGNDIITTLTGFDQVYGGDGDDIINADPNGHGVLDGGAGFDTTRAIEQAGNFGTANGSVDTPLFWYNTPSGSYQLINIERGEEYDATGTFLVSLVLIGDATGNVLDGSAEVGLEDLSIFGGGDADTLIASDDATTYNYLSGGPGNDIISGSAGFDNVIGGQGDDALDGGANIDTLDYFNFYGSLGINVNMLTGVTSEDGFGTVDSFANFENIQTSVRADIVEGDHANNRIQITGAGDVVNANGGDDYLVATHAGSYNGGAGRDIIEFFAAGGWEIDGTNTPVFVNRSQGVSIDLSANSILDDGYGNSGTLINIEDVYGSNSGDLLIGDAIGNSLFGASGDDVIQGGDGDDFLNGDLGNDTLTGGAGNDAFAFFNYIGNFTSTITDFTSDDRIDLNPSNNINIGFLPTFIAQAAFSNTAGELRYEKIGGQTLLQLDIDGDGIADETLTIINGELDLVIANDNGTDYDLVISNTNVINGTSGNDVITGTAGNDTINGLEGNDWLSGALGADVIDGGDDLDTASFNGLAGGVAVDLLNGVGTAGEAAGDTYISIENLEGTGFSDTLIGDNFDNEINGRGNFDTLTGNGGRDSFLFSFYTNSFSDTITDFSFDDVVTLRTGTMGGNSLRPDFIGTSAFGGVAGELRYFINGSDTFVELDFDGDTVADQTLTLLGVSGPIDVGITEQDMITLRLTPSDNILSGTDTNIGLAAGGTLQDNLETLGDDDWFFIDVNAGDTITFNLDGLTLTDTYLRLYDANEVLLAENDDNNGTLFSELTYSFTTAGRYYLSVRAFDDELTGTYELSASTGTINGTPGNDTLNGTANDDIINGLDGNDILSGLGGNDTINGGLGLDIIEGGAGADVMDGGGPGVDPNNDIANELSYESSDAGVAVDLLAGTASGGHADGDSFTNFNSLIGSGFADTLTLGAGSGNADGRGGDDTITGSNSSDYLAGGTRFSTATGTGNDTIFGLDGDDQIEGGDGADIIDGGAGEDDAIYAYSLSGGVNIDLAAGTASGGDATGDTLINIEGVFGSFIHNDILRGDGNDNPLVGLGGNDILEGRDGNDELFGGEGSDTLIGGAGADVLDGGNGFDTADYRDASSAVRFNVNTGGTLGDANGDTFSGLERYFLSDLNDVVTGSAANEFFYGEDGNDTINAGDGADRVYGGDGNDIQRGDGGNDQLYGSAGADQLNGGAGLSDIANYRGSSAAVSVNMATGGTGGDADGDTYFGIEIVYGSDFDDSLTGNSSVNDLRGFGGDDVLDGGGGNDRLHGGEGADSLIGGTGTDTAWYTTATSGVVLNLATGGSGGEALGDSFSSIEWVFGSNFDDTITGDAGANRLEGRDGNDSLDGGAGNDRLLGGSGDDMIIGGDGVDILFGQSGDDFLLGGNGNDFFFGDEGSDVHDGGAGIDTVSYLTASSGVSLNMTTGGYGGDAAGDSYIAIERIFGSGFDDVIIGSSGNEVLQGNGGADYLNGGAGNDSLFGGAGVDSFGFDTSNGGADIISGLFQLTETIYILGGDPAFDSFAEVMAVGSNIGANVRFDFGGGNSLTVINTQLSDLSASNFDFSGAPPSAESPDWEKESPVMEELAALDLIDPVIQAFAEIDNSYLPRFASAPLTWDVEGPMADEISYGDVVI